MDYIIDIKSEDEHRQLVAEAAQQPDDRICRYIGPTGYTTRGTHLDLGHVVSGDLLVMELTDYLGEDLDFGL